jgi:endo-1,4-beta-mannosidase
MTGLKAYRQTDIDVGSYWKPQEAQIISTMVEYLQGIQIAKEATAPDKNRSGNLMIRYEYFTRAYNTNTRYTMYSNTLWRWYY